LRTKQVFWRSAAAQTGPLTGWFTAKPDAARPANL
jgi:hypothetical protein